MKYYTHFNYTGNVVWLDKASSARAILGLSKRIVGTIKGNQKCYSEEDDSDEDLIIVNGNRNRKEEKNTIHVKDLRCPLPPGIWRKGRDYLDSRSIFLRFATASDRKLPFDEKLRELFLAIKLDSCRYFKYKEIPIVIQNFNLLQT